MNARSSSSIKVARDMYAPARCRIRSLMAIRSFALEEGRDNRAFIGLCRLCGICVCAAVLRTASISSSSTARTQYREGSEKSRVYNP